MLDRQKHGATRNPRGGTTRQLSTVVAVAVTLIAAIVVGLNPWERTGPRSPLRMESSGGRASGTTVSPREVRVRETHPSSPRDKSERRQRGLGFEPGDFVRYRFFQDREISLAGMASVSGEPTGPFEGALQTVTLHCKSAGWLSVRVYDETPTGWTLGLEVSDVEGEVGAPEAGEFEREENLGAEMAGEVLALMECSGRMRKLVFPGSMRQKGRIAWKDLLARWQVVLPENESESESEWSVLEEDTTGTYVAAYVRKASEERGEIIKTKSEYTSVRAGSGRGREADFTDMTESEGQARIVLDPRPLSVEGRESLHVNAGGLAQSVNSQVSFRIERRSLEHRKYTAAEKTVQRLVRAPGTTLLASPESVEAARRPESEVPEPRELLVEIKKVVSTCGAKSQEAVACLGRFVSAIRTSPRVVDAVLGQLHEERCTDELAALLIGALGSAGTEAAQEGLDEIISAEAWPVARKETALFAYARVEEPREEIDAILLDIYEQKLDLRDTALLLLGGLGERVRESDPGRFTKIERYLRDVAQMPHLNEGERTTVLEAMGNLGIGETPWAVSEAYRDPSERLRSAAVRAVRKTYDAAADALLLEALNSDTSERVRATAASVLARHPRRSGLQVLREYLMREPSEPLRRGVLAGLAKRDTLDEEARDLLDLVATRDRSSEIREYALHILK